MLEAIETVTQRWVGSPVARKKDEALLGGRARFIDDLSPVSGIRFAAILRSPHPHARIERLDGSVAHFLREVPAPDERQVRDMLSGHICRCMGYASIAAAVLDAATALRKGS